MRTQYLGAAKHLYWLDEHPLPNHKDEMSHKRSSNKNVVDECLNTGFSSIARESLFFGLQKKCQ